MGGSGIGHITEWVVTRFSCGGIVVFVCKDLAILRDGRKARR